MLVPKLGWTHRDKEVAEHLGAALTDGSDNTKKEIISALAKIRHSKGADYLIPLLSKDLDKERKKAILLALGDISNRSALEPLATILRDQKSEVDLRVAALVSLKRIDPGVVLKSLPKLKQENQPLIRGGVIAFLAEYGDRKDLNLFCTIFLTRCH